MKDGYNISTGIPFICSATTTKPSELRFSTNFNYLKSSLIDRNYQMSKRANSRVVKIKK
jgi:hypothetical protein